MGLLSWARVTGSPLIERFLYLLQKAFRNSTTEQVQEIQELLLMAFTLEKPGATQDL